MDIRIAARETKIIINRNLSKASFPETPSKLSYINIMGLLDSIEVENVTGEKAHRWLGWSQAAAVGSGSCALDDVKNINHAA